MEWVRGDFGGRALSLKKRVWPGEERRKEKGVGEDRREKVGQSYAPRFSSGLTDRTAKT